MSDLTFRPRFRIESDFTCEEIENMINSKLQTANPDGFGSTFTPGHFILRIHPSKKHFWSPQMDISIRNEDDDEHTVIRCLLAPAPTVWTMFMFLYALTGFGALVGFMIASSQYSLNKDIWGVWMGAGFLGVGIILYGIAQAGKKLAQDEMYRLRHFITDLNLEAQLKPK